MHEEGGREGVRRRQIPFSPSFLPPLGACGKGDTQQRREKSEKGRLLVSSLVEGKGKKIHLWPLADQPSERASFPLQKTRGYFFFVLSFPTWEIALLPLLLLLLVRAR